MGGKPKEKTTKTQTAGVKAATEVGKKVKRVKRVKTKFTVDDWTTLQKGDIIKVSGGPYWLRDGESEDKKVYMGESGKFRVSYIDLNSQAIFAYGLEEMGLHLIYMGPLKISEETGTTFRAHKVILIKEAIRPVKEKV